MAIHNDLIKFHKLVESFKVTNDESIDYTEYLKLFQNPTFGQFTETTNLVIAVYNYLKHQYEFVSTSVNRLIGEKESLNAGEGIQKVIGFLSPDSTKMMIDKVTPMMFEYVQKYPKQVSELRVTSCVELILPDISKWVLFNNYILCSTPENFPVLSCTVVTDVSEIKKDKKLYCSVLLKDEILFRMTSDDTFPELSKREEQIIQKIGQGKTTQVIADELCVSFETVKKHRSNILKKLDCSNTAELVNLATTMGLL